jgi:hypothetical protein
LKYRDSVKRRWLVLFAAAVAWGAITRPLTMLAFALPAGVCALVVIGRRRAWTDLVSAVGGGLLVLAILPIWNSRVVGDWRRLPQSEYARLYLPSDRLGFGASALPPAARLSPEEKRADEVVRRLHLGYSAAGLPAAAADRAANIIRGTWSYGGLPGLAVLFAAAVLPIGIARVVIGTVLCLFVAYLTYAHDPSWTLYYLELQPPLAFLTAVGVYGAVLWVSRTFVRRWSAAIARDADIQRLALAAVAVWLAAPTFDRIASYRRAHAEQRAYRVRFEKAISALPDSSSIVFVRYAAGHGEERLVENVPDLSSARTWIVHDLGPENARLLALAPSRSAYLYVETVRGDSIAFRLEPFQGAQSSDESERQTLIRPIEW